MISLTDIGRGNIVDFLVKYTNYPKNYFMSMKDNQLYAVYMRISEKRAFYIKELSKVNRETGIPVCSYTLNTLKMLKIDVLARTYKLNYGTSKNEEIVNEVISESNDKDLSYLTPNELSMIYGLDYEHMTEDDLRKDGYAVIEKEDISTLVELKKDIMDKIIELLLSGKFKNYHGKYYTKENLLKRDFDDLVNLYRKLTANSDEFPSYDAMEFQIRLMKN